MSPKEKYLEDAALVIDGRVAVLESEWWRNRNRNADGDVLAGDRAAIMEAKHLACLIRSLKRSAYRDPYKAAKKNFLEDKAHD